MLYQALWSGSIREMPTSQHKKSQRKLDGDLGQSVHPPGIWQERVQMNPGDRIPYRYGLARRPHKR